jgi:hypothetical protein
MAERTQIGECVCLSTISERKNVVYIYRRNGKTSLHT